MKKKFRMRLLILLVTFGLLILYIVYYGVTYYKPVTFQHLLPVDQNDISKIEVIPRAEKNKEHIDLTEAQCEALLSLLNRDSFQKATSGNSLAECAFSVYFYDRAHTHWNLEILLSPEYILVNDNSTGNSTIYHYKNGVEIINYLKSIC